MNVPRNDFKSNLSKLKRRLAKLRRKHEQLCIEGQALTSLQLVLSSWCDGLAVIQSTHYMQASVAYSSKTRLQHLQQQEDSLLLELLSRGTVASELPRRDAGTIAPSDDPMAVLRELLSKPIAPAAKTMAAQDLAASYRAKLLECSVCLHQVRALDDLQHQQRDLLDQERVQQLNQHWIQQDPAGQIKALLTQHFHDLISLLLVGRIEVMEGFKEINLDTLQPLEEPHSAATAAAIVTALNLTDLQQATIAAGAAVTRRLLEPIAREWEALQLQQHAEDAAAENSAAAGDSHTAHSSSNDVHQELASRQAQLVAEQERLARLHKVLHKRYMVMAVGVSWCIGCLTWPQFAQVCLLFWPQPLSFGAIMTFVHQQWEARRN